jgi:hypothetical protein
VNTEVRRAERRGVRGVSAIFDIAPLRLSDL